ncbi:helix-turn-helix psq domain [Holotrichia oblita]|uniref:Helix-turn-helix psq domain n=1 Tax=Holotrichia oblita TaxID=644536 RepID=A0ACB9TRQ5_HOLOL|nr:helix-turn-helix psq domain [Holotrichia oblita]
MSERNVVKKYCRFRYKEEALARALQHIQDDIETLNRASKKYNIPKSTLHNKLTQKTPNIRKMAPQPVLSELEENRIEQWITAKAMLGFPMHPSEIKDAVQKILTETSRPNPFKESGPGENG